MAQGIFPGITFDPEVVHGRPVIANTRVPVESVLADLAGGAMFEEVRQAVFAAGGQARRMAWRRAAEAAPKGLSATKAAYAASSQTMRC